MAGALVSTAGNCNGQRPSMLLTLAIATVAAANANRPYLDLALETNDSPLWLYQEQAAPGTAREKQEAVAQHSAASARGVMREAMPHAIADEGPRTRARTAAALQELGRKVTGEMHDTDKPDLIVTPDIQSTRDTLQAIADSEAQSASTDGQSGTDIDNQNEGSLVDTTSPPTTPPKEITQVVIQKKEKEIQQRWSVWSVRYILEEAEYAADTVPAWLQGIMFVINMMIGSAVIYFLHTTKYHPEHGCATAFCFFCCWPCGILSICFPVDEATPSRPKVPEPENAEEQRQEETPAFAQGVPEGVRSSVSYGMPEAHSPQQEEPRSSLALGTPEAPRTSLTHGMPEVQPAVMPTPETEAGPNKGEESVNVSLS